MTWSVTKADCIDFLLSQKEKADLVFGSPPYMDARTYGINAVYSCQEWVEWMLKVTEAAVQASKGLVLWVVAGVQRDLCYWPGCEGLAWEWWKRGNQLWRPCIWWKVDEDEGGTGIPGSGGKQWLRNDWEYVLAFKKEGWLPWADNKAMGHEPVCSQVGGAMSNRTADGQRINVAVGSRLKRTMDVTAGHDKDGVTGRSNGRPMPDIANPGNVIKARVGGGHMGSDLCHENEAPFPESLAEFFIRSFCPEGGTVCDPFSGSGTTGAVAVRWNRNFMGCDIRQSQVYISKKRIELETPLALYQ